MSPSGSEVSSAVFDRIRTCDNHCAFCFIYQLPKGMRRSLYLKDDDYRLSFLYGNFTTLTRFTELDAERVLERAARPALRLDPRHRSRGPRRHAAQPQGRHQPALAEGAAGGGIEVHGQVVVCPGVNDGAVLEDTMPAILDEYPQLATRGGGAARPQRLLQRARRCGPTPGRGGRGLRHRGPMAGDLPSVLGRRLVFAADEYYLLAGRDLPAGRLRGFPQHENGIGMVRAFERAFGGDEAAAQGVRHGFFAWVDGAPAAGYRAPRLAPADGGPGTERGRQRHRPATGDRRDRHLRRAGPGTGPGRPIGGADVRMLAVTNDFFGGNIGVAGLLTGADLARALAGRAGRRPLPAARRLPVRGPIPRRPDPGRPAPAGRDGAHRRVVRLLRALRRGMRTTATGRPRSPCRSGPGAPGPRRCQRRHDPARRPSAERRPTAGGGRRPAQRGQVVARQPHRRPPGGRGRGGARGDPGPQGARRRMERRAFRLVDTGGWLAGGDALDAKVSEQAERAVAEADVVLLVVDVTVGVTDEDLAAARVVRRAGGPGAAGGQQGGRRRPGAGRLGVRVARARATPGRSAPSTGGAPATCSTRWCELLSVGQGNGTVPWSARSDDRRRNGTRGHRIRGPGRRVLRRGWPWSGGPTWASPPCSTGSSARSGRSSTTCRAPPATPSTPSSRPPTARCASSTPPACGGRRRPSAGTEHYSVLRALDALERADIALLVIDATVGATHQDQRLAERIGASGCPAVVVLNKWDLVATEDREDVLAGVGERLAFLGTAPVLQGVGPSGRGVHKILPALHDAVDAYHQRVPTGALNRALRDIQAAHPPPGPASATGCRAPPTRRRSPCSPPAGCPRPICATSSAGCASTSSSGPTPLKLRVRTGGGR